MGDSQGAAMKAAALSAPVHAGGGSAPVRRVSRQRRGEPQVKISSVALVLSLFLVLIAATLLMGGHTVIDPLLKAAAHKRETHRMGDIVMSSPDGKLCRHLSFDNKTAELTEGAVEHCTVELPRVNAPPARVFSWGAH
jgi:hypothetical protein